MNRKSFVLIAAAGLLLASDIYAHHSQVAVYKTDEEHKIEGTLVQVMVRSPHSWVHVEAKDEKGETQRWAIEWGGASQLRTQGVDSKTLKVGDFVRVTGRPGRNPADNRMLMVYIERPSDGWSWGNRPGEVVD